MSNLGQIVALVGGFIFLLAAVRRAYYSRLDKEQISERVAQRWRSINNFYYRLAEDLKDILRTLV
jgi:hypothetical protein